MQTYTPSVDCILGFLPLKALKSHLKQKLHIQVSASNIIDEYEQFIPYAAHVSNLFTYHLPSIPVRRTKKLLVELSESVDSSYIIPEEKGQSIYTIYCKFPFSTFSNASSINKISMLTDSVYRSLLMFYPFLGLISCNVQQGYKQILDSHYQLSIQLCGAPKLNRSRKIKASVTAEYFLGYVLIHVTFLNSQNATSRVGLFKTVPVSYIYSQLVSSAKWINNEVFSVSSKSKEFFIEIKTDGSYKTNYNPKLRGVDDVKNEIRFLTTEVLVDL